MRRSTGAWLGALALAGCASGWWIGSAAHHPAMLIGEWTDSAVSAGGDTSVWKLLPDGGREEGRIRAHAGPGVAIQLSAAGYWFTMGELRDPVHRRLCVTLRPGRSPADCAGFRLDTVAAATGATRVRLTLAPFEGDPDRVERVLWSRQP